MQFSFGNLRDWQAWPVGELVPVSVDQGQSRTVLFDVMASDRVEVHVVIGEESFCVGVGDGQYTVKFSVAEDCGLALLGPDDALVMVRTLVASQVIQDDGLAVSFTSLEPRKTVDPQMQRLMHLMRLNSEQNARILDEERRKTADLADQVKRLADQREQVVLDDSGGGDAA